MDQKIASADKVLNEEKGHFGKIPVLAMHQMMQENKLILAYEGDFSQPVVKNVLLMAERNLEIDGMHAAIRKKVFNIMVECLQNILKHADDEPSADEITNSSIFLIGKADDTYSVLSGNPVHVMKVPKIKEKIDSINHLSHQELRQRYVTIISKGDVNIKGGSGLGFIDMARKSGKPLEYNFIELDKDTSFFTLKCSVSPPDFVAD